MAVCYRLFFLECLNYNNIKNTQMANYLSAIKVNFVMLGSDVTSF